MDLHGFPSPVAKAAVDYVFREIKEEALNTSRWSNGNRRGGGKGVVGNNVGFNVTGCVVGFNVVGLTVGFNVTGCLVGRFVIICVGFFDGVKDINIDVVGIFVLPLLLVVSLLLTL